MKQINIKSNESMEDTSEIWGEMGGLIEENVGMNMVAFMSGVQVIITSWSESEVNITITPPI